VIPPAPGRRGRTDASPRMPAPQCTRTRTPVLHCGPDRHPRQLVRPGGPAPSSGATSRPLRRTTVGGRDHRREPVAHGLQPTDRLAAATLGGLQQVEAPATGSTIAASGCARQRSRARSASLVAASQEASANACRPGSGQLGSAQEHASPSVKAPGTTGQPHSSTSRRSVRATRTGLAGSRPRPWAPVAVTSEFRRASSQGRGPRAAAPSCRLPPPPPDPRRPPSAHRGCATLRPPRPGGLCSPLVW
jgi:hypothetical protein